MRSSPSGGKNMALRSPGATFRVGRRARKNGGLPKQTPELIPALKPLFSPLAAWLCLLSALSVFVRQFHQLLCFVHHVHKRTAALHIKYLDDVGQIGVLYGCLRDPVLFLHLGRTVIFNGPSFAKGAMAGIRASRDGHYPQISESFEPCHATVHHVIENKAR